ncbi:MAG TPA: YceI family protein [Actinomycetota bacterium]|jgi:polyisoprenoid-binding protein YceI|nr:YceI family protein [Actinomycetota bacterium]
MSRRIALIALVSAVVLAGGGYGVFALMSGGGPEPVALSSPSAGGDELPEGSWSISTADSVVGYRVREKLAFLPAPNDAVGRTSAVSGNLVIDGLTVRSVDVTADLQQLRSDRDMRDRRIRELGLETDRLPDARFVLTEPISFDARPAAGRRVTRTVTGELTLHGVTRKVSLPVRAQWSSGRIEVIGSLEIQFADYDIEQIRLNQVTTEDHGTMELKLVFVPGSGS